MSKKDKKDIQSYTVHVRLTQSEGKGMENLAKAIEKKTKKKTKLGTLGREAIIEKYLLADV